MGLRLLAATFLYTLLWLPRSTPLQHIRPLPFILFFLGFCCTTVDAHHITQENQQTNKQKPNHNIKKTQRQHTGPKINFTLKEKIKWQTNHNPLRLSEVDAFKLPSGRTTPTKVRSTT